MPLEAADSSRSTFPIQIRVFASALHHASPTRIMRNVHHGCKRPMYAFGRSLTPGGGKRLFHQIRIEGRRAGKRQRKAGVVSVDNVLAVDDRNAVRRFLDGNALQLV